MKVNIFITEVVACSQLVYSMYYYMICFVNFKFTVSLKSMTDTLNNIAAEPVHIYGFKKDLKKCQFL